MIQTKFYQFKNILLYKKYNIKNYKANKDGSIDVDDNLDLSRKHLKKIPIKFNRITYSFFCHNQSETYGNERILAEGYDLTTLKNCPNYVGGNFCCSINKLTTLIGGPKYVGYGYDCYRNNLKDVYGFPEKLIGKLSIYNNPVCEILIYSIKNNYESQNSSDKYIRFIRLLNDYKVIRNQDTIIKDRLEESLYGIGINEFPRLYCFNHYKLI